jgi:hypothetical protein
MRTNDDGGSPFSRAYVVGRAQAYREAQYEALEVAATLVEPAALVRLARRFADIAAENERVWRELEMRDNER